MPITKTALETLPDLSEDYPLTSEQIQEYRERGHVLLPNLLSQAELDAYRPHILQAVEREQNRHSPVAIRKPTNWIFVDNLWRIDTIVSCFTLAPRFAKVAAKLLDVHAVRLLRNQIIFKKPGGALTPWHQHSPSFPLSPEKNITVWLNLIDMTPKMSMMIFANGTHHRQQSFGETLMDKDEMSEFQKSLFEQGYPLSTCRYYAAGDAELIDGWTLHGATEQEGDRTRESFVIVYYPDGARINFPPKLTSDPTIAEKMTRNRHQQVLQSCFPGLQPGDLAVTPMNPLVYSRQRDSRGK